VSVAPLVALLLAQAGPWNETFGPEVTASLLPPGCEPMFVGAASRPGDEQHSEDYEVAEALFAALRQGLRCSTTLTLADRAVDLQTVLKRRAEVRGDGWLVLAGVGDGEGEPRIATVSIYDRDGTLLVEYHATRGVALTARDRPTVNVLPASARLRHEISYVPVSPQATAAPVAQLATSLLYYFHLPVQQLWAWADVFLNYPPRTPGELDPADPVTAESLLRLNWAVLVGAEYVPLSWSLSPLIFVGAGVGQTSHNLPGGDTTFVDSGIRPVFAIGAGVRWRSSIGFTVRLELRALVTPGNIDHVFGCDDTSLANINAARMSGRMPSFAEVTPGCDAAHFDTAPKDIAAASQLLAIGQTGPALLLMPELGIGYSF